MVFNAYTTKDGLYSLNYGEGKFLIKEGKVTMYPRDNGTAYHHDIFPWDHRCLNDKALDNYIYTTKYHIPTSNHSALVCVEMMFG